MGSPRCWLAGLLLAIAVASPPSARAEADVYAIADLALEADGAHRYADAARLLERVAALAPHARWSIAAAEAWAKAGALSAAELRLGEALDHPSLDMPMRRRAEALLARIRAAAPHVARAGASPPAEAARAWEAAFAAADIGHFLVEAGLAWEVAERFEAAFEVFTRALRRDDLPDEDGRLLPGHLASVQARLPPPAPDRTAAWVTGGFAVVAASIAAGAFIVGGQHREDVADALADEPVVDLTRAEAQRKESLAADWELVGWVAAGSCVALAVTSVVLFSVEPSARSSVRIEAAALPDRLVLRGRF